VLGIISGAHGVRGEVRIKTFTEDPASIAAYGRLRDERSGAAYALSIRGQVRGQVIARIEGVNDRDAAELLAGVRLCVARGVLPPPPDEQWYLADLIGLSAEDAGGTKLGVVRDVRNFGAGDILEIARADGGELHLPFSRRVVPMVDLEARRLIVALPREDAPRPRRRRRSRA
jgi:16S rRNA processing protein RimM